MIRVRRANNGMKLFVPSRIAMAEGTQPMPEKKPSMLEFERRLNAIIHIPTGATWTTRPGSTEIRSFKPSKLGVVLADGSVYSEGAVQDLARLLIPQLVRPDVEETPRPKRGRPLNMRTRAGRTV